MMDFNGRNPKKNGIRLWSTFYWIQASVFCLVKLPLFLYKKVLARLRDVEIWEREHSKRIVIGKWLWKPQWWDELQDCNSPNPPLAEIVLFGFSLPGFPFRASPQSFKTHLLGRGFHTLIKNASFSSPTDMRFHKYGRQDKCTTKIGW